MHADIVLQAESADQQVAKRDLVEGLIKGIEVLNAFNDDAPGLTASDVAQRVGLSRSAARRYLLTLVHMGMATVSNRSFRLTPKVMKLGHAYLDSSPLPRQIVPFLERLTQQLQESTNFAVLDGADTIYLSRVNAPRQTSTGIVPGSRMPAYACAAGRVLLAALPDERIRVLLGALDLVQFTHLSIVDRATMLREIQLIRAQGYSMCENQYEMGEGGAAVLVKNRHGAVLGALSVSMTTMNGSVADFAKRCIPTLQATAGTLMKWI